jgi:hypothetical protein
VFQCLLRRLSYSSARSEHPREVGLDCLRRSVARRTVSPIAKDVELLLGVVQRSDLLLALSAKIPQVC